MIAHAATLDVSRDMLKYATAAVIRARRANPNARPSRRAVGPQRQALMVLRFLRDAVAIWRLARDAGVSRATGYRYLHEALDALAALAPTLTEAIEVALADGVVALCLDGTLVTIDRVDARKPDGRHLYYSGKHKTFGVNVQVIATTGGDVLWVGDGSPGSAHDIAAMREQVLDELSPFISRHTRRDGTRRLVVLADKGYVGADAGILTPTKRRQGITAHVDEVTRNQLITSTRAPAERANAALKMRWHALRRVSLDPAAVSVIAAAALTLTLFEAEHGRD